MKISNIILAALPFLAVAEEGGLRNTEEVPVKRRLTKIRYKGNNGKPSKYFPLGLCEGDCDNDDDCEGDLECYQRGKYDSVPGCSGGSSDSSYTDYCVEPDNKPDPEKLNRCEGDCDGDSDCNGDLVCFQRDDYECVPGCKGKGKKGHDYCIDEDDIPNKDLKFVHNH